LNGFEVRISEATYLSQSTSAESDAPPKWNLIGGRVVIIFATNMHKLAKQLIPFLGHEVAETSEDYSGLCRSATLDFLCGLLDRQVDDHFYFRLSCESWHLLVCTNRIKIFIFPPDRSQIFLILNLSS
jgi:hypothetical protein